MYFWLFQQKPTQGKEEGRGEKMDCLGTFPLDHNNCFSIYDRGNASVWKEKANKRKNCNSWVGASLQYLKKRICATAWRSAIFTVSYQSFAQQEEQRTQCSAAGFVCFKHCTEKECRFTCNRPFAFCSSLSPQGLSKYGQSL